MKSKKPLKPVKKRKKRVSYSRIFALIMAAVLVVSGVGFGAGALFKSIKKEPAKTEQPQETSPEETDHSLSLEQLQPAVSDAFELRRLSGLNNDIHTYFFNMELDDLKTEINSYLQSEGISADQISWSVQDLTTNSFAESDNAKTNFTAASTYKLPLTMVWYQRIANGLAKMSDSFIFTENMKEDEDEENQNQPIHKKFKVGDSIQLDELLESALLYSDNIAGHILFENLGGYSAYKSAAAAFSDSEQTEEFVTQNVLNADYTMDLLYTLYNTPEIFNDAKYWLDYASPSDFLNGNAPYGYIQKIGNINENRNALGLMMSPFPYSISIFSKIDKEKGEQVIADLGSICYNYFLNKYNSGFYDGSQNERIAALNAQISSAPENPVNDRPRAGGDLSQENNTQNHQDQNTAQNDPAAAQPAADANAQSADPNAQPAQ